jgi:hypothetical protein
VDSEVDSVFFKRIGMKNLVSYVYIVRVDKLVNQQRITVTSCRAAWARALCYALTCEAGLYLRTCVCVDETYCCTYRHIYAGPCVRLCGPIVCIHIVVVSLQLPPMYVCWRVHVQV